MDWLFYSKKILTSLVLPPTGPLLLAMVGLSLRRRLPRLGAALSWAGAVSLLLLSLPLVSSVLMRAAIDAAAFADLPARKAQAIVILGGGTREAPEYGGETVSELSLERVRYGAKLARELNLPILVTGGSVYGVGSPEGLLMAQALEHSFSTRPQWIESASRDTHENALFSRRLLDRDRVHSIILVTHDFHMRRAVAEFAATGLAVVPAPVTFARSTRQRSLPEHLPNANALRNSALALHELLGYWLVAP